jgi:hypothetical protein
LTLPASAPHDQGGGARARRVGLGRGGEGGREGGGSKARASLSLSYLQVGDGPTEGGWRWYRGALIIRHRGWGWGWGRRPCLTAASSSSSFTFLPVARSPHRHRPLKICSWRGLTRGTSRVGVARVGLSACVWKPSAAPSPKTGRIRAPSWSWVWGAARRETLRSDHHTYHP